MVRASEEDRRGQGTVGRREAKRTGRARNRLKEAGNTERLTAESEGRLAERSGGRENLLQRLRTEGGCEGRRWEAKASAGSGTAEPEG